MSHIFLKQTSKDATKEQLFDLLKNEKQYFNEKEGMDKLNTVYQTACNAYEGLKRYSGTEYITHSLNVAILLAEMEAEEDAVLAGLLCDVFKKTSLSKETLEFFLPMARKLGNEKLVQELNELTLKYVS